MCFSSKLTKSQKEIVQKLDAEIDDYLKNHYKPGLFNAFEHPQTPIVCEPHHIVAGEWGLIPQWANDKSIQNNTLNARIETLSEKPSFKSSLNNTKKRMPVIVQNQYDWLMLDKAVRQF